MSWPYVVILAGAALLLALLLRRSRRGWEVIAAALVLGLAGYAMQARPTLVGSPKASMAVASGEDSAMIEARWILSGREGPLLGSMLILADADMRAGRYEGAAIVLRSMVQKNPHDAEAWVALANALVAHAGGALTPAANYAFRRSAEADPRYAAPPFFLGLALARNGRLDEARRAWAGLLARTTQDSPLRADLENRLAQLDAFLAAQDRRSEGP